MLSKLVWVFVERGMSYVVMSCACLIVYACMRLAISRRPISRMTYISLGVFIYFAYFQKLPRKWRLWICREYHTACPVDGNQQLLVDIGSVYTLAPHGVTTFGANRLCAALYVQQKARPYLIVSPFLKYLPFGSMLLHIAAIPVEANAISVISVFKTLADQQKRSLVVYPGGVAELLLNAARNVIPTIRRTSTLLGRLLLTCRVHHVRIVHESRTHWHLPMIITCFQWINRYILVGIPLPPTGSVWHVSRDLMALHIDD